ncbi:MAG: recombinase family protein [Cyanosarcina radialis HA8281-LM2]|nr:recombinase family protein [Cyanosarcina radialis HA8281-LM2]
MQVIAYTYSDPLFEPSPDENIWGCEVDRIYRDLGDRSQLQELILDCQTESPNRLLIRRWEELGDSLPEVSDRLHLLQSLGIEVVTTEAEPLSSLEVLQQMQQHQHSRSIRAGHARNRLQGTPPPGRAPYGYKRGKERYILDRTAAPAVKDFFEQFLLYGCLRRAVGYIEKKYNKKISVSTGQRWLTNPVYRGDTGYQNGDVIADTHAAIVSREEGAQIDRLLGRNRRFSPRSASAPRSLAGLVVCGECNSPMTITRASSHRQQHEYLYLRPTKCLQKPKCQGIPYDRVLQQTIQSICHDLPQEVARLNSIAQTAKPGLPYQDLARVLSDRVIQKQNILEQLPSLTASGILDAETSQLRAYKLKTEIAKLQAQIATLPPVNLQLVAQTVSLPQFWLDLSESERRFYFREFLRQINIMRDGQSWEIKLIFIFNPI